MACWGLQIFCDRRRNRLRSVRWLPVFALTLVLTNLQTSTASSQVCPNGTYDENELTTASPTSSGTGNTEVTMAVTASSPNCQNCSAIIHHCTHCGINNSLVVCHGCETYYDLDTGSTNCSKTTEDKPSSNNTSTIVIAVVVSVVGVLLLAGIIVGIVFGVRRGVFERCHCSCTPSSPAPPPMPLPDELGVSFTNKQNEESGTGQRVDLRYTEEPGATTQNRVESVHYDGFNGPRDDDSVYMNDPHIPATLEEEDETYMNPDDQDDELYVNAPVQGSSKQSQVSVKTVTPVPGSSKQPQASVKTVTPVPDSSKAPRPRPKPKTAAKPTPATKPKPQLNTPQDRGSIFPPEDNEAIYSNEPESEDDDEDYVNSEGYQPGMR